MGHAVIAKFPMKCVFTKPQSKGIYNEVQKAFLVSSHILGVERI